MGTSKNTFIADLHSHSYYSDGILSPQALAQIAYEAGLTVTALSDHDTTAGVAQMTAACNSLGIVNLPAVEISAYDGCDVHILGFSIRWDSPVLQKFLTDMAAARASRIQRMLTLCGRHGMPLSLADVQKFAAGCLSRGHVARAMVAAGYEPDVQTCFDKWLNAGGDCYVPNAKATPEQAIEIVHAAGGVAVLAHPVRLRKSDGEKVALIARLAAHGLDGVEAVYKNSPDDRVAFFRAQAVENGLFVTPGGDFHDPAGQRMYPRILDADTAAALGLT